MKKILKKGEKVFTLTNRRNVLEDAPVLCDKDVVLPLTNKEKENLYIYVISEGKESTINCIIETDNEFSIGEPCGFLVIKDGANSEIYKAELFAGGDIVEKDFWYCLKKIVVCWFCGVL
jgi:hypothetical protein